MKRFMLALIGLTILLPEVRPSNEPDENSKHVWHQGTIFTVDEQQLSGMISLDFDQGVLMIMQEGEKVRAFTPHTISHFTFTDKYMGVTRTYITLKHTDEKGFKLNSFFEVVRDGKIAILRKEKKGINMRMVMLTSDPDFSKLASCYDYFTATEQGLTPFSEFSAKVLPNMQQLKAQEVNGLIEEYNLKLIWPSHVIALIDQYNQLFEPTENGILASIGM